MSEVLSLTTPFFGLIFLGFLVGRIAKKPSGGLVWMNIFIVYVALPSLFFQYLSRMPVDELGDVVYVMAAAGATWLVLIFCFTLAMIRTRGDLAYSTVLALIGGYSNNGYLGPGLALVAIGAAATVPVALIFSFESTMFFVMTPVMMAIAGSTQGTVLQQIGRILTRIFTHPFILAVIAGVTAAIFRFEPPDSIDRLLTMLTNSAAPCALFAMGVTVALQPMPSGRSVADISVFVAIKLIVHPLAAYLVLSAMGAPSLWLMSAVLLAALPTATNVFILATQYGVGKEEASNAILVGTTLAALTVTGVLYVIRSGIL
ncbi:AEC family transporter [Acuticoccus sp. I52.16.1]|uniref:AEC family transporter n=1 Tax=Acuticoccus sp. I52.16.1 TaxID=2928472 RepID=UPI001FD365F5|nr:AEC family transporter [Acuticoccus sp. I52.16.1]UOM34568.1 AEC family transporter [Acuticoccus sp. I52.16.1]